MDDFTLAEYCMHGESMIPIIHSLQAELLLKKTNPTHFFISISEITRLYLLHLKANILTSIIKLFPFRIPEQARRLKIQFCSGYYQNQIFSQQS